MKISVLLPTLGIRKKEIERLLFSLENQSYKNFEIIIISQDNHSYIEKILGLFSDICIKQIKLKLKGLSKARNAGLTIATGEIIILSDDDCWYPKDAFKNIVDVFENNSSAKFVLTQIYDKDNNMLYKNYPQKKFYITNKLQLMSKSSIEIAYKNEKNNNNYFDEFFGLGAYFVCGEEIDFLIRNYKRRTFIYVPIVTVYHLKKKNKRSERQIIAKGAVYSKNYSIIICFIIILRDLFVKKENNFKIFLKGYFEYKKQKSKRIRELKSFA